MSSKRLLIGISLAALAAGSAAAQNNSTIYNQVGTNNSAQVQNNDEGNEFNSSTVTQNGVSNSASVLQVGDFNVSFVQQIGLQNLTRHQQAGDANNSDTSQVGETLGSYVSQIGENNRVGTVQDGYFNSSTVNQGYGVDESTPDGEVRTADFNETTIDQVGAGLRSLVDQRAASAAALAASDNRASVTQRSSGNGSEVQQISRVTQESRGNYASVTQREGSTIAPNTSVIVQRNALAGAENPMSENSATVVQDGAGQWSLITQDGFRNRTAVESAGRGSTAAEGNSSTVSQAGSDLAAFVNFGLRGTSGTSNEASVEQSGTNHVATTYQFGAGDTISIEQENGSDPELLARGRAFVSQNAAGFTATVTQVEDNLVDITQAFGNGSNTDVRQVDAGDNNGRAFNSAIVSQYGDGNLIEVVQNAVGAEASIWQKVGSANNEIEVAQGEGRTGSTAGNPGFPAGVTGAGAIDLAATITQAGAFNQAVAYQDGVGLSATVEQNGIGTSDLRNIAFISQTGSGNNARVLQGSGVGASATGDSSSGNSGDEFYFAGGARSAEAVILQTSNGNSGSIEQYGRGQLARIEQSGPQNVATIVQEATAANATAVIRQTGSNNTYSIQQSVAGQYIVVQQTGTNNSITDVVTRP